MPVYGLLNNNIPVIGVEPVEARRRNIQYRIQELLNNANRGGVPIPQDIVQAIVGAAVPRNGNNAEMRRAQEWAARKAVVFMGKLIESKRALLGAARAAGRGSLTVSKAIARKAERLARDAYEMAPERQVLKNYASNLLNYARGLLQRIANRGVGAAAYASNLVRRLYRRRRVARVNNGAAAGPLRPAPSINNANINRQLNAINVERLWNANITVNRLARLTDNVPEFFMIKQMISHLNATATPRDRNAVLERTKQWLKMIRYFRDADAAVTDMLNRNPYVDDASLSTTALQAMHLYTRAYTPCHYEYLAINIQNQRNLLAAKKHYMSSVRIMINTAAKTFREVYNRVADKDEMVDYFVRTYGAAVSGFPCVDRGITQLLDVANQTDRRFPAQNQRNGNNNWAGSRVNIRRQGGVLTNEGRRALRNRVLQPYMARRLELNANAFNTPEKLWNAVKNKNLRINGQIMKVSNVGRNEINNYHRYVYG